MHQIQYNCRETRKNEKWNLHLVKKKREKEHHKQSVWKQMSEKVGNKAQNDHSAQIKT